MLRPFVLSCFFCFYIYNRIFDSACSTLPDIYFTFASMDINFDPNSVIYLLLLMRWKFALLIVIARNLVSNCLRH